LDKKNKKKQTSFLLIVPDNSLRLICRNLKVIKGHTYIRPGVDVMITIFCDFRQFLAKKGRFSQRPNLWSIFS
jgi:hypothetical protein